ncbi:MAG: AbrB/MazE/SpoVT family DNA-binding domain-containing protein [Nitrososphaerales archaeon]
MGTELAEVDERYRITIPKGVRAAFRVVRGQKFYLVPYGEDILMKPVPADAAERLDRTMGDFPFDRGARRGAEEWLSREGKK